jgi:hypothetical protein
MEAVTVAYTIGVLLLSNAMSLHMACSDACDTRRHQDPDLGPEALARISNAFVHLRVVTSYMIKHVKMILESKTPKPRCVCVYGGVWNQVPPKNREKTSFRVSQHRLTNRVTNKI